MIRFDAKRRASNISVVPGEIELDTTEPFNDPWNVAIAYVKAVEAGCGKMPCGLKLLLDEYYICGDEQRIELMMWLEKQPIHMKETK